ncbi:MAG TPA: sulfotransferase domain-containing protein [Rhizomicrobium sp.]
MPEKLFLCAGANRSGSTWQYNIVRKLAERAYGDVYGAWIAKYDPTNPAPVHVVKIHDPRHLRKLSYDAAITSYRDLRDVLVSARHMRWRGYDTPEEIGAFLDRYVRSLRYWDKRAVHVMRYEDMMDDPLEEAIRTAEALQLDLRRGQVRKICNIVAALEPPKATPTGKLADADAETLLHPGHIGHRNPALDKASHRFIERRYGAWLGKHEYEVENKKTTRKHPVAGSGHGLGARPAKSKH